MAEPLRGRAAVVVSRLGALVLISAVVGLLPWLSGRDPALSVLRALSAEQEPTPEALAAVRRQLGLDAGPADVLTRWVAGLVRGDLGRSWINGAEVLPSVLSGLGVSLTLMSAALVVALVVSSALCLPPLLRGARGDAAATTGGVGAALAALPEFLLAAVLLVVLSVWLGWFPPYGWDGPRHLVLPALALGVPAGAVVGTLLGDALPAVFREPWVAVWRSWGCTRSVLVRGALRRALPPLLPQAGLAVVGLTGGAVAVEAVFAVPGIGRAALGAARAQDVPVLQGCVLALLLLGLLVGAIAEAIRRYLLGPALRDAALSLPAHPHRPPSGRRVAVAAGAAVLAVVVIGWGLLRDPLRIDAAARLAAPGWAHPLGTDGLGRDVLARVAHGAPATIGVAVAVCACSTAVAVAIGFLPDVARGTAEAANAVPPVIAGILVAAALGPSTIGASLAVALVSWPALAAHAAALVEQTRASAHVKAHRALGAAPSRIALRHVLPAVAGPVARNAVLRLPGIALALASLGFLGLGTPPPAPEWGLMLAESLPYVERAPLAALSPAVMLLLVAVVAMSLPALAAWRPRTPPSAVAAVARR
ncbi:peptide/nickel transport system permease protein [Lentzea xinjiangensis]|uniref:Peptide/nickel transport system permease protein n=1 Tax=Lentzea xinjiangensis TaxID=402600 RepID=A0A1H9UGR9_9PSEU|nr:ABC transporter permease subunit [Lentzea xinjiangensis]SES08384.1 peptide/nickel transport system permease protein [Lentzea xinjiangensis]